MVIKFQISPSAYTENFIVRIWEAASDGPGAHVYEETFVEKNGSGVPTPGAGHQVVETFNQSGFDKVVHIVRMYGVTSGTLYNEYELEPLSNDVTIYPPIRFKIGDGGAYTPAAGTDQFTHPSLVGKGDDDYVVHRNNYGDLHPDEHYTNDSVNGSFQLNAPDQFNDDEEFTIRIQPTVTQVPVNDSVVGKWFAGFVDISANTNYSNSHLRKLIRFSGSPEYTFQTTDVIPQGYIFAFQHFGSAGTAKVKFQNGTLLWSGSPKSSIDIPQYCEGAFVWDGTNWNVVYMVQSTWQNAGATPAGSILGVGRYNVGDVAGGDPIYTITHNLNISGDYLVFFSLESNDPALYHRNNKVGGTWWHHATEKNNKFYVSLQEISAEVQNLTIAWLIVKI